MLSSHLGNNNGRILKQGSKLSCSRGWREGAREGVGEKELLPPSLTPRELTRRLRTSLKSQRSCCSIHDSNACMLSSFLRHFLILLSCSFNKCSISVEENMKCQCQQRQGAWKRKKRKQRKKIRRKVRGMLTNRSTFFFSIYLDYGRGFLKLIYNLSSLNKGSKAKTKPRVYSINL